MIILIPNMLFFVQAYEESKPAQKQLVIAAAWLAAGLIPGRCKTNGDAMASAPLNALK